MIRAVLAVLVALALLPASYAQPLELSVDGRRVVTFPGGSVAPDPFQPFSETAQFSTVSSTRFFGTGRASTADDGGVLVTESRYLVTFEPTEPVQLHVTGSLLVSSPEGDATARAQIRISTSRRPSFPPSNDMYLLEIDADSPQTSVTFDEVIGVDAYSRFTFEVRGDVVGASDGDVAFASWFIDVTAEASSETDTDRDGVPDGQDNCVWDGNPTQLDGDNDGIGNRCDIDFNNDCWPGVIDLGILRTVFFSDSAAHDINADGVVNAVDLALFRALYFQSPGPSGVDNFCTPAPQNP